MTTAPDPRSPVAGERLLARVISGIMDRDPDAAERLKQAFTAAVDDGVRLDEALGLHADWRAVRARARRDELLRTMWRRWFPSDRAATAAGRLHMAVSRYELAGWRRESDRFPAHRDGTIEADCWRVLQTQARVPTERQIRKILQKSTN